MEKREAPEELNLGTIEQNEEEFDKWFHHLLFLPNMTCLLRDVLRKNRRKLFETWLEVRPWNFEDNPRERSENG